MKLIDIMKTIIIIYNVIFLSFGNVLFSNIHHMHHHGHGHHEHHGHNHSQNHKKHECEECIVIKNTSSDSLVFQTLIFLNNNISLFINDFLNIISDNFKKKYSSRAPPKS